VTTKVDRFNFGVVLMELITRHKALDDTQPEESMCLVTWFWHVFMSRDGLRKVVDPILDMTDDTFQNVCIAVELAGNCTSWEPFQCPEMSYIVSVLS